MKWRVGGKVPLNVYEGDKPMFQCHTPEDAARVVDLLNAGSARVPFHKTGTAVDVEGEIEYLKSLDRGATPQALASSEVKEGW